MDGLLLDHLVSCLILLTPTFGSPDLTVYTSYVTFTFPADRKVTIQSVKSAKNVIKECD